jgi:protein-S-isoprenylcysteine O-methyltransferase Ste14
MILSVICTVSVSPLRAWAFRQARPAGSRWNIAKTSGQIVLFWSVLLFIAPYVITLIEERVGLARFSFALQRPLAVLLFGGFGALGVWSGFIMAHLGQGTPLPLDSPRRLVVRGPYAFVRNPMAIASFGQGFAVALWWGSPLIFAYVVAGVWTWQFLARPLEEEDLRKHFAADFDQYYREVRCWWPRRDPYRRASVAPSDSGPRNTGERAALYRPEDEYSTR